MIVNRTNVSASALLLFVGLHGGASFAADSAGAQSFVQLAQATPEEQKARENDRKKAPPPAAQPQQRAAPPPQQKQERPPPAAERREPRREAPPERKQAQPDRPQAAPPKREAPPERAARPAVPPPAPPAQRAAPTPDTPPPSKRDASPAPTRQVAPADGNAVPSRPTDPRRPIGRNGERPQQAAPTVPPSLDPKTALPAPGDKKGVPPNNAATPVVPPLPKSATPTPLPNAPGAPPAPAAGAGAPPAPAAGTAAPTPPNTANAPGAAPPVAAAPAGKPGAPLAIGAAVGAAGVVGGAAAAGALAPPVPQSPQAQAAPQKFEDVQKGRQQRVEDGGRRTVIQEPGNRIIIKQDNRIIIQHDEAERFRRVRDAQTNRRPDGIVETFYVRPDGFRVVTEVDGSGRLLRRYRRGPDGREFRLIDNRRFYQGAAIGIGVGAIAVAIALNLPPPRVTIPRERYIVDYDRATDDDLYEALTAPPVERLERAYSLDEVRYNYELREHMRRVDLNDVTFEFGAYEIGKEQYPKLERLARSVLRALRENPEEVFLVEGHTDAVGADVDNLSLSDRRAAAVAQVLSETFGVPPENLVTQGYGEQYLKVKTQDAERANRRVAVRRITPLIAEK